METVKLGLMILLLLGNVLSRQVDDERRKEGISEAPEWPNAAVIQDLLVKINRKPKPSFKGKPGSGRTQTARKRHRFQTFIGLMGKRSDDQRGVL